MGVDMGVHHAWVDMRMFMRVFTVSGYESVHCDVGGCESVHCGWI